MDGCKWLVTKIAWQMYFHPENPVVKLCNEGMMAEVEENDAAKVLFEKAWAIASNDFEKFIAAHYIARHQHDKAENLKWNNISLAHAIAANDETIKPCYSSLYLNVGKSFEDMGDYAAAKQNYLTAKSYISYLPDDGYGRMIAADIEAGISRCQ